MKRVLIFAVFITYSLFLNAQLKAGFLAGVSTFDIEDSDINIFDQDGFSQYRLFLKESSYGFHFGIWTQIKLGNFIIRPEFIFNSNSVDFSVFNDSDPQIADQIFSEKYQHFDIPLLFGFKFGMLRLNAGPVGHVFLASQSDLFRFSEYEQTFEDLTIGWQAGLGFDLWKLSFDLRYEDNFTNFGNHIRFFGNKFEFTDRPSRLIATLGYRF